ncbi:hypothetical protein N7454_003272 [Penicillium verhagenii]|nr:hypothetical protein N7454_003272 [Penicillium verhagenii]
MFLLGFLKCLFIAILASSAPNSIPLYQTSVLISASLGQGNKGSAPTISTIWTTRVATVIGCPASVTGCPLRSKTTSSTTETLAVGTTTAANTLTATAATISTGATSGSSSGAGGRASGSGSGSGSGTEAVYTALYTIESCASGNSCTEYVSTSVLTQTNAVVAQPSMTCAPYKPVHSSSAVSASSAPV